MMSKILGGISPQKTHTLQINKWRDVRSLAIREMQTKIPMKCYFISMGMAKIKISDSSNCWWGYGETRSLTLLTIM